MKRSVTVEKNGNVIAVYMTGGYDCLWLNMYIDTKRFTITADSDIGNYAFSMFRWDEDEGFVEYLARKFKDSDFVLRHFIGPANRVLDREASKNSIRRYFEDQLEDDDNRDGFLSALDDAFEYVDDDCSTEDTQLYLYRLEREADSLGIELNGDWYEYAVDDYTAWHKRFAEICERNIAPALKSFIKEADNGKTEDRI